MHFRTRPEGHSIRSTFTFVASPKPKWASRPGVPPLDGTFPEISRNCQNCLPRILACTRTLAPIADRFEAVHLFLPYEEGGKLAELYALGAPIEEREDQADGVYVRARLPHREVRRFARYLVAEARSEPARRAR